MRRGDFTFRERRRSTWPVAILRPPFVPQPPRQPPPRRCRKKTTTTRSVFGTRRRRSPPPICTASSGIRCRSTTTTTIDAGRRKPHTTPPSTTTWPTRSALRWPPCRRRRPVPIVQPVPARSTRSRAASLGPTAG